MNHAVLYVRDARRHQRFYSDVLGFSTVIDEPQPHGHWGTEEHEAVIRPLDLAAGHRHFDPLLQGAPR